MVWTRHSTQAIDRISRAELDRIKQSTEDVTVKRLSKGTKRIEGHVMRALPLEDYESRKISNVLWKGVDLILL